MANERTRRALVAPLLKNWGLAALLAMVAHAQVPTRTFAQQQFVDQLKQRGLHRLTEVYCEQQLSDSGLDAEQRADLVLQLLDSLAAIAQQTEDRSDVKGWQYAMQAGHRHLATFSDELQHARITLHLELVRMAQADWLHATAALDPDPNLRRQQASVLLREAVNGLGKLEKQLSELLRQPPLRDDRSGIQRGNRLRNQVVFKRGEAQLRHAKIFPAESPDRVVLLTEALNHFGSLARLMPATDLTLESQLGEIEGYLLLDKLDRVEQRLQQFPLEEASTSLQHRYRLVVAQWQIAAGQAEKALDDLTMALQTMSHGTASQQVAETRLARMNVLLALAKQPQQDDAQATRWQRLAIEELAEIQRDHDPYDVRRGEAILAAGTSSDTRTAPPAELEVLARTAANFFRRSQWNDAHLAFRRAAEMAEQLEDVERAADYAFQAAAIRHQQQQAQTAAHEFRELATRYPESSRAAEAHWLAILNTAQIARDNAAEATNYQQLLQTHLERWPNHPTSDQARYWYGKLLLQLGATAQAQSLWQAISFDAGMCMEAQIGLRSIYLASVGGFAEDSAERRNIVTQAITHFHQMAEAAEAGIAEETDAADSDASPSAKHVAAYARLTVAELRLGYTNVDAKSIRENLERDPWNDLFRHLDQPRVLGLQGLAAACEGNAEEARSIWETVTWADLDYPHLLLGRLNQARQDVRRSREALELAKLQADFARRVRELPSRQHDAELAKREASARQAMGDDEAARQVYEQLLKADPHQVEYLAELALLQESGDVAVALDQWRKVVRHSPDRSDRWWQGKLGIARMLNRTGDLQRASTMLKTLAALYPDLGGPQWKPAFERELRAAAEVEKQ